MSVVFKEKLASNTEHNTQPNGFRRPAIPSDFIRFPAPTVNNNNNIIPRVSRVLLKRFPTDERSTRIDEVGRVRILLYYIIFTIIIIVVGIIVVVIHILSDPVSVRAAARMNTHVPTTGLLRAARI